MGKLEQICEELTKETTHPDFRLWLTSKPNKSFPQNILQNSLKMTIEPPKGLKANLKLNYSQLDDSQINGCLKKPEAYKTLMFGLILFHAVIQERRKFGAIGWNIPYEFSNEDLEVCQRQLLTFLEDYEEIPFKVLNFICADINYGGRVTDDKDKRLISTMLKNFMNKDVLAFDYLFSASGTYRNIAPGNKADYLMYINKLPGISKPGIFGLSDNAEITTNQNTSFEFINSVLKLQSTS